VLHCPPREGERRLEQHVSAMLSVKDEMIEARFAGSRRHHDARTAPGRLRLRRTLSPPAPAPRHGSAAADVGHRENADDQIAAQIDPPEIEIGPDARRRAAARRRPRSRRAAPARTRARRGCADHGVDPAFEVAESRPRITARKV